VIYGEIPNKPEEIFSEITNDSRHFGNELISIILYGSGAGEITSRHIGY